MPWRSSFRAAVIGIWATLSISNADSAHAQAAAQIRPHPAPSSRLLAYTPDTERAVYLDGGTLLSEDAGTTQVVQLDGTLMVVRHSASGRFAAALTRQGAAGGVRIYAADGTLQQQIDFALAFDERLPRMAVSDSDGRLAIARPSTAVLCLVAIASEPQCTKLFKDARHDTEREIRLDFTPDGRFVAVAAQHEAARADLHGDNIALFLFDAEGSLIWERHVKGPGLRALSVSADGHVAVSSYDAYASDTAANGVAQTAWVLSATGEVVASAPFGADEFIFNGSEVTLQSGRSVAALEIDSGESRLLFQTETGRQIVALDRARDPGGASISLLTGRGIYAGGGFAFDDLQLVEIDDRGTLVAETPLDVSPQARPRIRRSANAVTVLLDDSILIYAR